MSLLIVLTQPPESSLASDSYGVIATAAMLDQEVSVVYCGLALQHFNQQHLIDQLHNANEFGVKGIYACLGDSTENTTLPENLPIVVIKNIAPLVQASDKVINF